MFRCLFKGPGADDYILIGKRPNLISAIDRCCAYAIDPSLDFRKTAQGDYEASSDYGGMYLIEES